MTLIIFVAGCGSLFKKEEPSLEPKKGAQSAQEQTEIFVCAGDIDVTYKRLGEISLGEFGFSGHDILAYKIKEKALAIGAQAVINVQYDTGASKSWQGYGELGGTDYGVRHTSWCKGTAINFLESHDPLGLMLCSLTRENKEWFGFKRSRTGVLVVNIGRGSIAADAGIEAEDLIIEWNGEKIENKRQLEQMIRNTSGKEARLNVLRDGEIKTVRLSVPVPKHSSIAATTPKTSSKNTQPALRKKGASPENFGSNSADVHNEVGDLYLRKEMYNEAIEEYKKAIEADPDCAIAYFNLSIVYEKIGMKEKSDEAYKTYKKLKPKRVNPLR